MLGHKPRVRAVIFDWAGTTVDFGSRAPVLAFVRTFAEFGVTLTAAGAHVVIQSVADLLPIVDAIEAALEAGAPPQAAASS